MSMLGAKDNEPHSYLEITDAIRQYGAQPDEDLKELSAADRVHGIDFKHGRSPAQPGFLYAGPRGWRLSPAFDLNPVPVDVRPRVLSTAISVDEATASVVLAMEVAEYFGLSPDEAKRTAGAVGAAVSRWRAEARDLGLDHAAIDRIASAFEHDDLKLARGFNAS